MQGQESSCKLLGQIRQPLPQGGKAGCSLYLEPWLLIPSPPNPLPPAIQLSPAARGFLLPSPDPAGTKGPTVAPRLRWFLGFNPPCAGPTCVLCWELKVHGLCPSPHLGPKQYLQPQCPGDLWLSQVASGPRSKVISVTATSMS